MKVIDLINMKYNKEEMPNHIIINRMNYFYNTEHKTYVDENNEEMIIDFTNNVLNYAVEVIKDDLISTWDKNWRPEIEEAIWFINMEGEINYFNYADCIYYNKLIKHNRIFKTKELAEKWLEIDTYLREKSFEPDWNDSSQEKWSLQYDFYYKDFYFVRVYSHYNFNKFYFETEEIKDEIFKKYSQEELKFYFNIGE